MKNVKALNVGNHFILLMTCTRETGILLVLLGVVPLLAVLPSMPT